MLSSLVPATSFHADPDTVGFSAADLSGETPYFYSRWSNPTTDALEQRFAVLEGGETAVTFSSGMAASAEQHFSGRSASSSESETSWLLGAK